MPKEKIPIPDMIELWKKIYFKTEEVYANTCKEFITTNTFVDMLGQIRDQYLSNHKLYSDGFYKYIEMNPIASKKDIARIAELIIALEDKLDNLESQFGDNLNSMTKSLIKLVDFQQSLKNEALILRQDISILNEKLDNIGKALQNLPQGLNDTKAVPAKKKSKKNTSENVTTDERRDLVD